MKKNRILMAVLAVVLCVICLAFCRTEAKADSYGTIYYKINNGEVTITGCQYGVSVLDIPSYISGYPVTAIDEYAFSWDEYLTTVWLPEGITVIGQHAFDGCSNLRYVYIPDSVSVIGESAFSYCTSLDISYISADTIGEFAFYHCNSLEYIEIYANTIEESAFGSCENLKTVTLSQNVTYIGPYAFSGCDSLNIFIVNKNNPAYCNDDNGVLYNKNKTTLVSVPAGYSGKFTVPNSVTFIEENALIYCPNVSKFAVSSKNTSYTVDSSGVLFNKKKTTLIKAPTSLTGSYTIPSSVTSISKCAFANCTKMTSVTIPNKVNSMGMSAFFNCSSLTSVTIPSSVTEIGQTAFAACSNLETVTIPSSVNYINFTAFYETPKLNHIIYGGTQVQWYSVLEDPSAFSDATVHFKATEKNLKTTTTKATLSKNGSIVKKCTLCGYVESNTTIKYVKTVKLSKTSFVYNGKAQKPTVTVKDSAGKTLKKGTDYDVTYASGCKKAGTYKVTVKFKGNYSGTKTLTFKINPKAAISTQPKTQKVETGEKIKFTVKATGTGLKYQWQYSTNGKTWKNCSASEAKKASFSFKAKTSHDGNYYRCKVTDSAGNVVYTKAVRAYVLGIEKQPVKKTVTKNKTAKFTVDASGNGLKYQWQYSTNGGKTWKTCSGSAAKKAAYSFKAKISQNGYYFRCKITDSAKNVIYTSKVKLTVKK